MRIFGVDIRLGSKVDEERKNIEKQMTELQDYYFSFRPTLELMQTLGTEGVRIPWFPLPMKSLYDIAMYSDVLRNIIHALKTELFRHGLKIEEKFVMKCEDCEKEFQHRVDKCDVCGSINLRVPNISQKYKLERWIKRVNDNEQSLIDVCKMINDDLEIVDDGYMIVLKDYIWDSEGNVVGSIPVEVLRGHPMFINIIADKTGRPGRNEQGEPVYTCLIHRDNVWYGEERRTCPHCGRKLYQAYFKATGMEGKSIYYVKGEVCHRSKYMSSLTYGFSPILAVWQKAVTLINQDKFIKDYYTRQRPPRGLLFVSTPNMASLEKAWNWMLDMWKKNPHMIPPIGIEAPQGGRRFVEFIDFLRPLDEMQFIEGREEFRRAIGAVYGVMPLFTGEGTSGVRNEGLQIVVTTRAVENGQGVFNEGFFPFLLEQLEITDYELKLVKPEFRDELTIEQIKAQKIANAQAMANLGFKVVLNEEGEFEFIQPTTPTIPTGQGTVEGSQITAPPQEQRFAGEPTHQHASVAQRFAGETVNVTREDLEKENVIYYRRIFPSGKVERMGSMSLDSVRRRWGLEAVRELKNRGKYDLGSGDWLELEKQEIKKQMEEDYRWYLEQYGESAQAVGWKSEEDQINRFEMVSEEFEEDNPEIMDVGAGLGHFYQYLKSEGFKPIYEGIDIVPEFIERARKKGINVKQMDAKDLDRSYDYVIALGTFTFTEKDLPKVKNPWEHTKERLKVMWDKTKKKMIVSLLVKPPYPEYIVFDKDEVENFIKTLTPNYEIITSKDDDRIQDDEIIIVAHKNPIKGDAPVTTTSQSVYFSRYSPEQRRKKVRAIYVGKLEEIKKEVKKEYELTKQDEDEIEHIADNLYAKPFAGLSKRLSDKIKDYLLDAYEKQKRMETIVNFIKRIAKKLTYEESEMIARTEMSALSNKAREWSYLKIDPEKKFKYRWIGPDDNRTTQICKNIKARTARGVSLDELKKIIDEEGRKGGFEPRDFLPHINCRHTFMKV